MIDEVAIGLVKLKVLTNKHPLRKNNTIVAAMYDAYLHGGEGGKGLSIAGVAALYRRTRQSVFSVFRTRGYELRHKPMKGLVKIRGVKFMETKGGYLRGTLPDGRRVLAHRWLWEKKNGEIPRDMALRFLDGNPKNVNLKNIELVPIEKMPEVFMGRTGLKDWKIVKCLQCGRSKHDMRRRRSARCFALGEEGEVTEQWRRHLWNANPIRKSWT